MKKLLTLFILITVAIFSISCGQSTPDTGEFVCEFDKATKTATITEYTGKSDSVTIPESFGKYTVTSIGREAFSEKYDISEIKLPSTLKTIEASAFELCISLKEIVFPDSLETIGNTAFADCRNLKKIQIPKNLRSVGICAFTRCTSLESFAVEEGNNGYSNDSYGALFDKTQEKLIVFPAGSQRKNYEMPETVLTISEYAFEKTQNLESVTFSPALTRVESYAFQGSSIQEAYFGDKLEEIGSFCFNESKLTTIEIGSSLKKIGESAFAWCLSLDGITLPSTVEEIGVSAFYMCTSFTEYAVDSENPSFSTDERGVLFNKDKTVLFYYPIANTAEEYMIPHTVTEISYYAFSPCLNLKKVTVPDSVKIIEEHAFAQCSNLADVIYEGTKPEEIAENAFD